MPADFPGTEAKQETYLELEESSSGGGNMWRLRSECGRIPIQRNQEGRVIGVLAILLFRMVKCNPFIASI
jgi:hypothetical protein